LKTNEHDSDELTEQHSLGCWINSPTMETLQKLAKLKSFLGKLESFLAKF